MAGPEEILADLIRMPSAPTDPMEAVVGYSADVLRDAGLDVKVVDGDFPVVTASRGEGGVLFSGHLDTVPIGEGWSKDQAEVVDGRLYGRGAADMKGPCAAMMAAARALAREDVPFSLILTTDEETTMGGARGLKDSDLVRHATFVLVGEPTDFRIGVAEKGVYHIRLITRGKAAHGSTPHLGQSAIWAMHELLDGLKDLSDVSGDPMETLTLNVGTIAGGTKVNVVPAECCAELDIRFPPGRPLDDVRALVRERLGDPEVTYDMEEMQKLRAWQTDPASEGLRSLQELTGAEPMTVPYGTEMAVYAPTNPKVAIFGPGKPDTIHGADEYIDLEDLARGAELYAAIVRSMA